MVQIGVTYSTKQCGNLTVISYGSKYGYYRVKFHNTGTEKECRDSAIIQGCVRDPYAPLVCGVACVGNISTKREYGPYYSVWHDMINRCYNPNDKRYKAYQNVSVCKDWLVFENFYRDRSAIDGYTPGCVENGLKVLDKDLKQRFSTNKVYSVQTCTWVDKAINNRVQDAQQKMFCAKSPFGEIMYSDNISEFARDHGLTRQHIANVLHGRTKTTAGWVFSYKEIV